MTHKISKFKNNISDVISVDKLKAIVEEELNLSVQHCVKYVFSKIPGKALISKPLAISNYPKYLEFFIKNNPDCKNTDWLQEYFSEMVNASACYGLFVDDVLVSCSDMPGIPYMKDQVQEIGINTIKEYRGNGYASDVCINCIKAILRNNKCPLWSTSIDNIFSQKLAEKIGFVKLADTLTVSMP